MKVSAGLVSPATSLLGLWLAAFLLHPHQVVPHVVCVLAPSPETTSAMLDEGPP